MVQICKEFASTGRNFGNKLFTYAVSRIISDEYGYKLDVPENSYIQRNGFLMEFPYKSKDGIIINSPLNYVSDGQMSIEGIDPIIKKSKDSFVAMDGYFLRYDYIKSRKEQVKKMFMDLRNGNDGEDDMIILLRDSNVDHKFKLPNDYYTKILKKERFNKLFVSYDHLNKHESLIESLSTYNPILLDMNILDLFKFITKKNKIIGCQGTFSFWACFLSEATKIYWPITKEGPNSIDRHVNLKINDEERIEFIHI